jgi:uncharacterized protein involved in outer membrane biogenesis
LLTCVLLYTKKSKASFRFATSPVAQGQMKFKKIIKILGVLLILFSLGISVFVFLMSDKIKAIVLTEVNRELAVEGGFKTVELTFWRSFPNIGVRFEELTLKESTPLLKEDLLHAGVFYLEFNVWKALKGQYAMESMRAHDLSLRLAQAGSQINYQFLKENKDDTTQSDAFSLNLKGIKVSNAWIAFHDIKEKTSISYSFDELRAKGVVETARTAFDLIAEGRGQSFVLQGDTLPLSKKTSLYLGLIYENESEQLKFVSGHIDIDGTALDVKGDITFGNTDYINLSLASEGNKVSKVAGLLPQALSETIQSYQSEGEFSVRAEIVGSFKGKDQPVIDAKLRIANGKLTPKAGAVPMEDLFLTANLYYAKGKESLQIPMIRFVMGEHAFQANLELTGFSDPYLSGKIAGALNLAYLDDFLEIEGMQLQGILSCKLQMEGRVSEIESGKIVKEKGIHGTMEWRDIGLVTNAPQAPLPALEKLNAAWKLTGNLMESTNIKGQIDKSPFSMEMQLQNLLPYFFSETSILDIHAIVKAEKLLIPAFLLDTNPATEAEETDLYSFFTERINLHLQFDFGNLELPDKQFRKLKGIAAVNANRIQLSDFSGQVAEGSFEGTLLLRKRTDNKVLLSTDIKGNNLNVQQLFRLFDNFGQEEITDKNLEGKLSLQTQLMVLLSRNGSFEKEDLYAFTDLQLNDGSLKNYEAMKELSAYAEVKELENVRFKSLSNTFEIRDGEINFPYMNIGNNIMNMQLKGSHRFDNYMDYTIRVNLSDALAAKYKIRSRKEKDDFEELGDKGIALIIRMTGYADNLKFKFEKITGRPAMVPEAVASELRTAREEFRQSIVEEFSKEKREQRKTEEAAREKVEWDE